MFARRNVRIGQPSCRDVAAPGVRILAYVPRDIGVTVTVYFTPKLREPLFDLGQPLRRTIQQLKQLHQRNRWPGFSVLVA